MNETKFDGMGGLYAKFRPSYPRELMGYLQAELGFGAGSVVADVGSGTGIFTGQLLGLGCAVYAVEPNPDMRAVAESDLRGHPGFVSIGGADDSTGLADGAADFVTAAQAFHWFDADAFKLECARILKPNGKVVLVWNRRDETCELVRESDAIIKKYCPNFKGSEGGTRGAADASELAGFFSGEVDARTFNNDLIFDEEGFVGRNLSGSYALKEGDADYGAFVGEMKEFFNKRAVSGKLSMPNLTRSFAGAVC